MTTRNYSANAIATTLSAGINDSTTTVPVVATTGYPAAPFIIAVDYGAAEQEVMLVTAVAGLNLTVTRGYDSTTAQAHSLGAAVRHVHSAIDLRDSRTHEAASTGVHGATGAVVGTTDTQALTNKDLSSATNTFPTTHVTTTGTQTLTNKDLSSGTNTFPSSLATDAEVTSAVSTHAAVTATHGATGAVVGTTNTQTLTNKTLTSPTINSPTIDSPTVTGVGEVRYLTKASDEPVTSSTTYQDDDTFTFSVAANATYVITFVGKWTEAGGGEKAQWTLPAGAAFWADGVPTSGGTSWFSQGTGSGVTKDGVTCRIITGGTAGTATLQWAQNSSHANATTLKGGAFMVIRRVA